MQEVPSDLEFPFLEREQKIVYEEPCTYNRREGQVIVPDYEGDFLAKAIKPTYLGLSYQLLEERDVRLYGFRTFVTSDSRFFNDNTVLPGYNPGNLIRKFQSGAREDVKGTLEERGLLIQDLPLHETIEEPIICLASDEPSNYGSWIYRFIPKLINCPNKHRLPIFTYLNQPWMLNLLKLLHGDLDYRRQETWKRYQIKQALIPTMRNSGLLLDDATISFYREAAARLGGRSSIEKVYLSRQGQARKKPEGRNLLNELEIISVLESKGYSIVEPETLSMEDQIRLIRDAKHIICPGGSGLFNLVFARSAERVVDLEPNRTWIYAHHNLIKSCGIDHTVIFGTQPAGAGNHAPWSIDIAALAAALP